MIESEKEGTQDARGDLCLSSFCVLYSVLLQL